MNPPTVSVIICTHDADRFGRLGQAITSVCQQSHLPTELLLVVDGDEALLAAARAAFPQAQVMRNARAKGLSGARNTGLLAASGVLVAFLDDDAIAEAHWLASLLEEFQSPRVFGVGGPILASWPNGRPSWLPETFNWVVGCSFAGQATEPGKVRNLIGCNMAFRRNALVMAGLFDETLGRVGANAAGAEETELCIRAGQMFPMSELRVSQGAVVVHQIDAHRASLRYYVRRCIAEGRSKAMMRRSGAGLSSERRQLLSVLPKSVFSHLADRLQDRDRNGLAKAAAVVLGAGLVVGSFVWSKITRRAAVSAPVFAPVQVCDVDLDAPQAIAGINQATGTRYASAHCVVRMGGRLAGVVQLPLYGEELGAEAVRDLTHHLRPADQVVVRDSKSRVRVVVATRDRPEMLARCLDSLLTQDHNDFSVVVVDNAPSSTATRDMVTGVYAPTGKVSYLVEPRPGLANAHNRGLEALDADVVAFTDDDVIADPLWLSTLIAPFADAEVGCVTGGIVPAELETLAQLWTEQHGAFLKGLRTQHFDLAANRQPGLLYPHAAGQFGSGANMAFSRRALAALGGRFDPALGAGTKARGGDDLAAFADVVLAGLRLVYVPHALVWHHHRRSTDGMKRQAYNYGVGLGAYLTRSVLKDPRRLLSFALALPAAAAHLASKSSNWNTTLSQNYPRSFVWSERLGILAGVPAYLRSAAVARSAAPATDKRPAAGAPAWKGN
jgi:cellulose synthase/poly-beta-1,6-N-acetylglucosamine synthase-like glycosyltransferase